MCLILFAHDVHPEYRLLLAANRDEFHDRPTAAASFWGDEPSIFAGRDLLAGGTWLGVTREGRWGAVTNFRDGADPRPEAPSRGHLVPEYLTSDRPPDTFARTLLPRIHRLNGFNLLVGDTDQVVWLSNRRAPDAEDGYLELAAGVYGISNHLLDTPWPKVVRGRADLERLVATGAPVARDELLSLLLDRSYAAEHELPDTGVEPDLEQALSARFISTPVYGTRSSSALIISRDGRIHFAERSYDEWGDMVGEEHHDL